MENEDRNGMYLFVVLPFLQNFKAMFMYDDYFILNIN
jgi:hypothetical protein